MNTTLLTVILLVISDAFMTIAWYGHLKHKSKPLVWAIVASWLIAFVEYCFAVPANRIASATLCVTQLKITQEAVTLVFALIASCFSASARRGTISSLTCC